MTSPNINQVFVSQPNTAVFVDYIQEEQSLLRRAFGVIGVDKPQGSYYVWERGSQSRNNAKPRAPGTKPAEANLALSRQEYSINETALRVPLYKEYEAIADFELRPGLSKFVAGQIMISETIAAVNAIFTTGVWTTDNTLSGGAQWDVYATSNPYADITAALRIVTARTGGRRPNVMIMNGEVADVILNHPDIRERDKRTILHGASIGERAAKLQALFDVAEVLIVESTYNTSAEGASEVQTAFVTDRVWIGYREKNAVKEAPSAGYVFSWTGQDGAGGAVEIYPDGDPGVGTTWFHGKSYAGFEVVSPDAGYLFVDVLST